VPGSPGMAAVDGGLDQVFFGSAPRARAFSTNLDACRQVASGRTMKASSSGNQPPSNSLTELAARNAVDMKKEA